MRSKRVAGQGWLVLIGGGEFSFGETELADEAWLAKLPSPSADLDAESADPANLPKGATVAFVPAASGSADYGRHFSVYLDEFFGQAVEPVPIYRDRDARRGRNIQRLADVDAVYLGGGVADDLLEGLRGTPCQETLETRLRDGGVVVAIAAAAHAAGVVVRALRGRDHLKGLGWLDGGVVETNFVPGQDRRLRRLLRHPAAAWGLGIPAGSAVLIGPDGALETVGPSFRINGPKGALIPIGQAVANAPTIETDADSSDAVPPAGVSPDGVSPDGVPSDDVPPDGVESDDSTPS